MVWVPKFKVSKRAGKKYSVITPSGRCIHFGASDYEHFRDSTGIGYWSHKDHNDKRRRASYRARHRAIKRNGKHAYKDKESPAYYSWHYLW